jgi:hypothetical protein
MTTLIENDLPVSTVMQAVDGPLIITKSGAASVTMTAGNAGRNPSQDRLASRR